MPLPTNEQIAAWVGQHIGEFHAKRLINLGALDLRKLLKRKNPYLFRAKNVLSASDIVVTLLDAHLSSQEETLFGDFLEKLAVWINAAVFSGRKSSTIGIDLEFDRDGIRYVLAIKSGPNWANSSQIRAMRSSFLKARQALRTGDNPNLHVEAINGCCYGRCETDCGDYRKLCGQSFWSFISGSDSLYTDIVEPLGHQAAERDEAFRAEYAKVVNRFTGELIADFCDPDGALDWERLLKFNSGRDGLKLPKRLRQPV